MLRCGAARRCVACCVFFAARRRSSGIVQTVQVDKYALHHSLTIDDAQYSFSNRAVSEWNILGEGLTEVINHVGSKVN